MTVFDETPALRQLLTSYYHEDWTMDRRNYAEMVRDFASTEPRAVVSAATTELRAVLAKSFSDDDLEVGLTEVGCAFYQPSAELSAREWLSNVAAILGSAR